ncbi:hypothetical protein BD560DRAFT_438243 [Blakeslea trispora]|nr:hypothetical protein BD560DRAFT_438243 [Blakeslea trispora]
MTQNLERRRSSVFTEHTVLANVRPSLVTEPPIDIYPFRGSEDGNFPAFKTALLDLLDFHDVSDDARKTKTLKCYLNGNARIGFDKKARENPSWTFENCINWLELDYENEKILLKGRMGFTQMSQQPDESPRAFFERLQEAAND